MVTSQTWELLLNRSGGVCEICRLERATNVHHRRPRGMGGTRRNIHTVEWLLHLCGSGTTGCHGMIESQRERAYRNGWLLRQHQHPMTSPVWIYGNVFVILTPTGKYEAWGARGWQMEPATPEQPGEKPGQSSSVPAP